MLAALTAAAVASSIDSYTTFQGLNCYTFNGGLNIDNSSTAPSGLTLPACQQRCECCEPGSVSPSAIILYRRIR
jgi:hypothetical protein